MHLLIKFKLHFLPESVAVVSLGKILSSSAKLEVMFSIFKTNYLWPSFRARLLTHIYPTSFLLLLVHNIKLFWFLSLLLTWAVFLFFFFLIICALFLAIFFLLWAIIAVWKSGSYLDHSRSLISPFFSLLSIFPCPLWRICALLILLISVLQGERRELGLHGGLVTDKTNTAAF